MTPSREDLELYVTGNYDGDVAALERAIAEDPKLATIVAEEARLDMLLRDAAVSATFCAACEELVRGARASEASGPDRRALREPMIGAAASSPARCDACGAAVRPGGYVVERVLVKSGHGRMYVARDADGKQVALKELAFLHAPSAAALAAFEREAKFLRALEHPAIPRFCAAFEEGSGVHTRYYLAQELVAGRALDHIDDHWYSEAEIVDIARQVLGVLVYLQSLSPMVIHRDIKPANLIKRGDGSIAVVDFGAAHVHGTTAGSTTIGTFGYMPTEQLAGIVDATTDLFALGASLLYLLTRQEPWRLAQTKTSANVSAPLRAFLDKLTATDPRARFQSAAEALRALDHRDALAPAKKRRWWPSKRALAIAAAALFLGGGTFATVHHLNSDDEFERVPPLGSGGISTVKVSMPAGIQADMIVDGIQVATVTHESPGIPVGAGVRHIKLIGKNGLSCDDPNVTLRGGHTTTLECNFGLAHTGAGDFSFGTVKFAIPQGKLAKIYLDGKDIAMKSANEPGIEVVAGTHHIRVLDTETGRSCEEKVLVQSGKTTTLECNFGVVEYAITPSQPAPPSPTFLDRTRSVSWDFKQKPFHDVMRVAAESCKFNYVVSGHIDPNVTLRLNDVPCNEAVQVLLDSLDLRQLYDPANKLLVVGDRSFDQLAKNPVTSEDLAGSKMNIDVKNAPLRTVIEVFAYNQKRNIVVPDHIDGKVTVLAKGVHWQRAFEAVLKTHDLWYEYRKQGNIIRVAPRKELVK